MITNGNQGGGSQASLPNHPGVDPHPIVGASNNNGNQYVEQMPYNSFVPTTVYSHINPVPTQNHCHHQHYGSMAYPGAMQPECFQNQTYMSGLHYGRENYPQGMNYQPQYFPQAVNYQTQYPQVSNYQPEPYSSSMSYPANTYSTAVNNQPQPYMSTMNNQMQLYDPNGQMTYTPVINGQMQIYPTAANGQIQPYTSAVNGQMQIYPTAANGQIQHYPQVENSQMLNYPQVGNGQMQNYPPTGNGQMQNYPPTGNGQMQNYPPAGNGQMQNYPTAGNSQVQPCTPAANGEAQPYPQSVDNQIQSYPVIINSQEQTYPPSVNGQTSTVNGEMKSYSPVVNDQVQSYSATVNGQKEGNAVKDSNASSSAIDSNSASVESDSSCKNWSVEQSTSTFNCDVEPFVPKKNFQTKSNKSTLNCDAKPFWPSVTNQNDSQTLNNQDETPLQDNYKVDYYSPLANYEAAAYASYKSYKIYPTNSDTLSTNVASYQPTTYKPQENQYPQTNINANSYPNKCCHTCQTPQFSSASQTQPPNYQFNQNPMNTNTLPEMDPSLRPLFYSPFSFSASSSNCSTPENSNVRPDDSLIFDYAEYLTPFEYADLIKKSSSSINATALDIEEPDVAQTSDKKSKEYPPDANEEILLEKLLLINKGGTCSDKKILSPENIRSLGRKADLFLRQLKKTVPRYPTYDYTCNRITAAKIPAVLSVPDITLKESQILPTILEESEEQIMEELTSSPNDSTDNSQNKTTSIEPNFPSILEITPGHVEKHPDCSLYFVELQLFKTMKVKIIRKHLEYYFKRGLEIHYVHQKSYLLMFHSSKDADEALNNGFSIGNIRKMPDASPHARVIMRYLVSLRIDPKYEIKSLWDH